MCIQSSIKFDDISFNLDGLGARDAVEAGVAVGPRQLRNNCKRKLICCLAAHLDDEVQRCDKDIRVVWQQEIRCEVM